MRRKGKYINIWMSSNDKYHDLQPQSSIYQHSSRLLFYTSSHTFLIPPGPGIFVVSRNILKKLKLILPIKLSEDSSVCDSFFQSNFTNRLPVFYVLRAEVRQRVVKHVREITWTDRPSPGWGWRPVVVCYFEWLSLYFICDIKIYFMLRTLLHPRSCLNQAPSLPPVIDNQGNLPGNALLNYHVIKTLPS